MGSVFFSERTSTAGKNLPYKGSPSAGTDTYPVEVEDTEDNKGERGTYMFRTKRDLYVGGDVRGGKMNNAPGVAGVGVGGVGAGGMGMSVGGVGVGGKSKSKSGRSKRKSGKRKSGKRKSGKRKSGKRKSGKRKSGKRKSGKSEACGSLSLRWMGCR